MPLKEGKNSNQSESVRARGVTLNQRRTTKRSKAFGKKFKDAPPIKNFLSLADESLICIFVSGQMRSLRLFYSNVECTSGQLVIASQRSQYKILHFHHGGLDKLAQIFEQWNVLRTKSIKKTTQVR